MNWLWAYFRRKVFEAIHAGVYDALAAQNGASGLTDEQATKALHELLRSGNPAGAPSGEHGATPPKLTAPEGNGQPALTEAPRRGPGRPRKYQEPPEPQE
jgi:hypothetical protein